MAKKTWKKPEKGQWGGPAESRWTSGRPSTVLTREDIERAIRNTQSNKSAAMFCRVSWPTYKKYAKLYKDENGVDLYEKHKSTGKGIRKFRASGKGFGGAPKDKWGRTKEPKLSDLIYGKVNVDLYNPEKIRYRMVGAGLIKDECYRCGFKEKRDLDGRSPMVLIHKNGNKRDWTPNNIEVLCYNCLFLQGPTKGIPETKIDEKAVMHSLGIVKKREPWEEEEKFNPEDYKLDSYQEKYLQKLLGEDEEEFPGSEYISRL